MEAEHCPRCRGRAVGRVGIAQWYCWDCCVEFARSSRGIELYEMDEEGELRAVGADAMGQEVAGPCEDSVAAS